MSDYQFLPWPRPITKDETKECLAIAICGLEKIANYTEDDNYNYGDPGFFARTTLDAIKKSIVEGKI